MIDRHGDELERYLALDYPTLVEADMCGAARCYVARHPDLRGCMSHGATPEEALTNLREVRELYLSTLLENGVRPPEPGASHAVATAGSIETDPVRGD